MFEKCQVQNDICFSGILAYCDKRYRNIQKLSEKKTLFYDAD